MSDYLDLLLCNPNEAALFDALERAARLAHFPPAHWDGWASTQDMIAGNAEGRWQWQISSNRGIDRQSLAVAWWRDHLTRLHVRVTAGNPSNPGIRLYHSRTDDDERPPWWHVCPGRVYRVKCGDAEPVWVAACACGEVGTPAQLGWAGECCGPCHDRREEGAPLQVAEPPLMLEQGGATCGVAFDPTGERLAISSAWRIVYLYDLATGARSVLYEDVEDRHGRGEIRPLIFSPGGELVAVDRGSSHLRIWNLTARSYPRSFVNLGPNARMTGLAFSPSGRHVASSTEAGDLRVWERAGWQDIYISRGAFAVDFSPDGQTLAVGSSDGVVRLLDTNGWEARPILVTNEGTGESVYFVKHALDGSRLVVVTGGEFQRQRAEGLQVRLVDLASRREERAAAIPVVSTVEMTPDGRYLAWLVHDDQHSPAAVHFWDVRAWRTAGWLEWDPEDDLRDLSFSPDGETMATGSSAGVVKLWPWRLLLEGKP